MWYLTIEQYIRYECHVRLPEIGEKGQIKLLQSRVLLVGAGGLGSPVALYLAAAGIGTLGIVDYDSVNLSNLQRQIIHSSSGIGKLKAPSVTEAVTQLTPDVATLEYVDRLDRSTVDRIFEAGWHVVIDAVDNLETRYLRSVLEEHGWSVPVRRVLDLVLALALFGGGRRGLKGSSRGTTVLALVAPYVQELVTIITLWPS